MNPGQYIENRWKLVRKISEGGGGAVWLALDSQGTPCAMKFLKWSPLKSEEKAAEHFKSEFTILKSLSHPHISKIHDFGKDPLSQQYYFTNELLEHGDLKSFANAPIELLENLLLQALRALEYLRNCQLLHLDIKPQNLMLRRMHPDPELALIDFGLATFRPPNKPGGTPNYMPPEVIVRRFPDSAEAKQKNWGPPDHRSDLYSLGVSFYFLFTNIFPFEQRDESGKVDTKATMLAHLQKQVELPSSHRKEIPPYLDRIIMRLMARDPDDRFPSAAIAAQTLQFRSPYLRTTESSASLLAYLPKEGKLVGRKEEQKFLLQELDTLHKKKTSPFSIVFVTGQRGLGKTRLLQSVKNLAQALELRVFAESAHNLEKLDQVFEDSQDKRSTILLLDDAEQIFLPNSPPQAREVLHKLCWRLKLQEKLHLQEGKFLIIMSCDSSWVDNPTERLPQKLKTYKLSLNPFTASEIQEYLQRLLGDVPSPEVISTLSEITEGNPLFLTELFEKMISSGRLFSLAGRPDPETLKELKLDFQNLSAPPSYAEELRKKFYALPDRSQELAALLACYHEHCDIDLLQKIWNKPDLGEALLPLVEQQIAFRDTFEGSIGFVNSLSASVIHNFLWPQTREKWHDKIVTQLEQNPISFDELLLTHKAQGSSQAVRITALTQLAKRALHACNNQEARPLLEKLFAELDISQIEKKIWCLQELVRIYDALHLKKETEKALLDLQSLKFPLTDLKQKALCLVEELRGMIALKHRDLAVAEQHFTTACQLAPNLTQQIRMQNWMASLALRSNRVREAITLFRQQREYTNKLPLAEQAFINNNELGEALLIAGQIPEAIQALQHELNFAHAHDDIKTEAKRHYLLGEAYSSQESELALQHYEQAYAISEELRDNPLKVRIVNGLAHYHVKKSDYPKAVQQYERALQLSQQVETETVSVELMVNLGFALAKVDRYREAVDMLEAALDFSDGPKGIGSAFVQARRPEIYISLGDALYQLGENLAAEKYLLQAMNFDIEDRLSPLMQYNLYGTLCEVYLRTEQLQNVEGMLFTLRHIVKRLPEAAQHISFLESELQRLQQASKT